MRSAVQSVICVTGWMRRERTVLNNATWSNLYSTEVGGKMLSLANDVLTRGKHNANALKMVRACRYIILNIHSPEVSLTTHIVATKHVFIGGRQIY